jgi:hypothetical protein
VDADVAVPRLVLAGLALAVLVTVGVAGATSTTAFGVYNPGWEGATGVGAVAEERGVADELVHNVSAYGGAPANGSLAVVLSPATSYAPAEVRRVETFVRSGGTVLVATDFRPAGNALLGDLGTNATVSGLPLRDEHRYGPGPAFPRAVNASRHAYTAGVDALLSNHPSVVEPAGATVLLESSSYGYVDANRNEELDDNETLARYPVATVEPLGAGQVVVVSDPSAFINAMLDRGDNRQFLRNVVGAHDRVLVDVSKTGGVPPIAQLQLLLRESGLLQLVVGLGGLAAVLGVGRTRLSDAVAGLRDALPEATQAWLPRAGRGEVDPAAADLDAATVAAAVRERHPAWDDARVERVTEGIIRRQRKPGPDD